MIERMLRDFDTAHGLKSIALRYFNAAGADPEGEIGEAHDPETHLIPLALEAALGRRPAIQVFGQDSPTPDGTCIRDYSCDRSGRRACQRIASLAQWRAKQRL
jgi:UDP-glucose 4-epimerase